MTYKRLPGGKLEPLKRTPEEVLKTVNEENVRFIDLQFTDVPGRMQHTTIVARTLSQELFEVGSPKLDGSSIRGFVGIEESDMMLRADSNTFAVIPWSPNDLKTARLICDVYWGFGEGRFERDPRYIAQKAEEYLSQQGFDKSYWGPEIEFFIFDKVYWDVSDPHRSMSYRIESKEAAWNTTGINFPIRYKEGYFPVPPQDTLADYRAECSRTLEDFFGIANEVHHHEVATAGQAELDMYRDTLTNMADNVVTYKYIMKNLAYQRGMVATMMPKPIFGDNASGMHTHVSLWKRGKNMFYDPDDEYAELSQLGRYFIGGLMEHSHSLCAIIAPTTNSYKRLVPGYEAPVYVEWSRRNRSTFVRVPVYMKGEAFSHLKRIEYRPPDPSCNPYLTFTAILMAGLDGIKKKVDPGSPVEESVYAMSAEKRRQLGIKQLPGSLKEAVEALQGDQEYLKPVLPQSLIDTMIEFEMEDHKRVSLMPHPYEFYLYFDI